MNKKQERFIASALMHLLTYTMKGERLLIWTDSFNELFPLIVEKEPDYPRHIQKKSTQSNNKEEKNG